MGEAEGVGQLAGHIERDDDGLVGVGNDAFDPQRVEMKTHTNAVRAELVEACWCCARTSTGSVRTVGVGDRRSIQIALKCSNGSPQARHLYSALHAVDPYADSRSVLLLSQRGHGSASVLRRKRIGAPCSAATGPGGAMPYSRSLRRPSALIQSVVQAGARCSRTSMRSK